MILPFLQALLFLYLSPLLAPHIRFVAFAPFLVIALARNSSARSLWIAFGCGLLIDMLSPGSPMGLTTVSYVAAMAILMRSRRHIFVDKAIGISAFTTLFSALATAIQLPFVANSVPLTRLGLASDLIAMPILDGIYAFCWFHCPAMLYTYLIRIPKIEEWIRTYKIWKRS